MGDPLDWFMKDCLGGEGHHLGDSMQPACIPERNLSKPIFDLGLRVLAHFCFYSVYV